MSARQLAAAYYVWAIFWFIVAINFFAATAFAEQQPIGQVLRAIAAIAATVECVRAILALRATGLAVRRPRGPSPGTSSPSPGVDARMRGF